MSAIEEFSPELEAIDCEAHPRNTRHFDSTSRQWSISAETESLESSSPSTLTVSSYNVLIDSENPPTKDRDPLVVTTILGNAAKADILILQEVSNDFLSYLLDQDNVRYQYPFTSHGPPEQPDIGPHQKSENIVVLSKWPFSWKFVPFRHRHEGAVVAIFKSVCGPGAAPLVVAGVPSAGDPSDDSVIAKESQLQILFNYLSRNYLDNAWVIAADFSIPMSPHAVELATKEKGIFSETVTALSTLQTMINNVGLVDTWSVARIEGTDETSAYGEEDLFYGEESAIFDPRNNKSAAATHGTSRSWPRRYNRILLRSQRALQIGGFNRYSLSQHVDGGEVVASYHYGVRALLQPHVMNSEAPDQSVELNNFFVEHIPAVDGMTDSMDIISALRTHGMFPSDDEAQQRRSALFLLKQTLLETTDDNISIASAIPMVIVPVGSYALGGWTSSSNIDCLCIGTISSKTFFKLARQRLKRAESNNVRILRKVEVAAGTMLELSVNGIAIELQYCPAASIVEKWSMLRSLPLSDPVFNLSFTSLRKLKPYRDLLYLQRTLPSFYVFRLAYRSIKLWAMQRGIYSAKFGYLGGVHITLMLSWVCKRLAHNYVSVTTADIVSSFFHHYGRFDWANEMVFDVFFHKKRPRYHRSQEEPVVVLGFHTPNSNVAHTATLPGLQILVEKLRIASRRLLEPGMTWAKFFEERRDSSNAKGYGVAEFLQTYDSYVKLDMQFWGRTQARGKTFVGWVESRSLSLVVDIHKLLQSFQIHIWPGRFTDSDQSISAESTDYHSCYLIGLLRPTDAAVLSKEERQRSKHALQQVLDRFTTQLKMDEKNYDAETSWVSASLARPNEVRAMHLDGRQWGEYAAGFESDSDDDDDETLTELTEGKRRTRSKPTSASTPVSSFKLRPASDVLNRLRWDPHLDANEYVIGYEDRFLGVKEIGLGKWKTEQTDEEFIPQHRILYFKKRGGDSVGMEVVWERATRLDRVFGSGVSDASRQE